MARSNFRSGRGGGRGNQGRGNYKSGSSGKGKGDGSDSKPNYPRKTEKIFSLHYPGRPPTATYEAVKEEIILKIQADSKDGGFDVAMSLKQMEVVDLSSERPVMQASTLTDATAKALEQSAFRIDYTKASELHQQRIEDLRKGLKSAYAIIYKEYCTPALRDQLQKEPDFATAIENNPIALLKAIQVLSQTSSRAQYPMVALTESFCSLLNIKQFENESLLDYVKRFKHFRDVLKGFVGTNILDHFSTTLKTYKSAGTDADKQAIKDEMFGAWMAHLFLYCADKSKYGSVLTDLRSQYSKETDQYPRTLSKAIDVLSNHQFDPKYYESQKKKRENQQSSDTPKTTSFAQTKKDVICYCCGKKGHVSPKCNKRDEIPREKWFKPPSTQAHHQEDQLSDDDVSVRSNRSTRSTSQNRRSGHQDQVSPWSAFQQDSIIKNEDVFKQCNKCHHESKWSDVIMLDTGSTMGATIMNPDFVTNIRLAKKPITMQTNAGSKLITLEADVSGFGTAYYDPTQVANIFGFAHMADKYRVTYDSKVEDAFLVHTGDGVIKFK